MELKHKHLAEKQSNQNKINSVLLKLELKNQLKNQSKYVTLKK